MGRIVTAYLVIGLTMDTMSISWPNCRSCGSLWISARSCPEMNRTGVESSQAPLRPLPNYLWAARHHCDAEFVVTRVRLCSQRGRLLMLN